MEKLMYALWKPAPKEVDTFRDELLSDLAPALKALSSVQGLRVCVADSAVAEAAITAAKPNPAANICNIFALRSPAAVESARRNPCVPLLESIKSWLGPGVLIKARTVAT